MQLLASVDDYERKYGATTDEGQLAEWLSDATGILLGLLGNSYDEDDSDQAMRLMTVCRDMVYRAFSSACPGVGVQGMTQSANGFSETYTYESSSGALYLTRNERKLLGIGTMSAGYLTPDLQPSVAEG